MTGNRDVMQGDRAFAGAGGMVGARVPKARSLPARAGTLLLFLGVWFLPSAGLVQAQTMPGFGGSLSDGVTGLMKQGLPNVSQAGAANTAGVLSYCVKNNFLQGDAATSVMNRLAGKTDVQSSSAFSLGQQGQLETGNGNSFSLSGLKEQAKSKLCDLVLEHAQSLF